MRSTRYTLRLTGMVAVLLLIAAGASAYDGEPTDAELADWWAGLTTPERVAQVRLLDRVEHATPVATFPTYAVIIAGDEIILQPQDDAVISVGHLSWSIGLPEQRAAFDPISNTAWIWAGIGGAAMGLAGGWLIWQVLL